ncbi:MAG: hypothetical protein ABI114_05080 [Rhodanobacter sp.]
MMLRALLLPCVMLVASVAIAQTAAPIQPPAHAAAPSQTPSTDQWQATPAVTSSSDYSAQAALSGDDKQSPFQFKQPVKKGPAYALPPQANDKATVMGKQRPWQNGRPPVDCRYEPRDPVCR